MGFDASRFAARRLRLVAATTPDPELRRCLLLLVPGTSMSGSAFSPPVRSSDPMMPPPMRRLVPNEPPPAVPLADAGFAWAVPAPAEPTAFADAPPPEESIPRFSDDRRHWLDDALVTNDTGARLLAVANVQAAALAAVLQAHEWGAIALPESVLAAVAHAGSLLPRLLAPGTGAA